jgi:hypothetical protein
MQGIRHSETYNIGIWCLQTRQHTIY